MIDTVTEAVRGLPPGLAVLVVAAIPIAELRGAIPLAIGVYDMNPGEAFIWAFVGNLAPVPVILFALEPVSEWLRRHSRFFDRFFVRLFDHTRTKHSWRFDRWRDLALVSFVAIPLPMTGAWSGALAAFLFGVRPRRAIPLIAIGIVVAGAIVSALVLSGLGILGIERG